MENYTLNPSKLAPQIESEDLQIISDLKPIPKRTISVMCHGLSIMTVYLGLENKHEKAEKRWRYDRKLLFWVFIIIFGIFAANLIILFGELQSNLSLISLFLPYLLLFGFLSIIMYNKGKKPVLLKKAFEKDLIAICDKMNVDYYSTGLEASIQKGGGSTWFGWGSAGAVGAGLAITAVSKIFAENRNAARNENYKRTSVVVSYCQISEYFNQTYNAEEYNSISKKISLT